VCVFAFVIVYVCVSFCGGGGGVTEQIVSSSANANAGGQVRGSFAR